jgi:hypothetical protein
MGETHALGDVARRREMRITGLRAQQREAVPFDATHGEKQIIENRETVEQQRVLIRASDADAGSPMRLQPRDVAAEE